MKSTLKVLPALVPLTISTASVNIYCTYIRSVTGIVPPSSLTAASNTGETQRWQIVNEVELHMLLLLCNAIKC
jgi:hypothetical protein